MKLIKKTIGISLLLLGVFIVVFVFINTPTKHITDRFATKVSAEEINDGYHMNYVGKFGDDTVPVFKSSYIIGNENYDYDADLPLTVYNVQTEEIIPIGYYQLKNSDDTTIGGSSYKNRNRITRLDNYTDDPFFIYKFLYGEYYLVKLDDGSYITAFMNRDYAYSNTLPLADLESIGSNLEEDLMEAVTKNTDIPLENINFEYSLVMQPDEANTADGFFDIMVRILITGVTAIVVLIGLCYIDKKANLL